MVWPREDNDVAEFEEESAEIRILKLSSSSSNNGGSLNLMLFFVIRLSSSLPVQFYLSCARKWILVVNN